jgi:hypothetical protein
MVANTNKVKEAPSKTYTFEGKKSYATTDYAFKDIERRVVELVSEYKSQQQDKSVIKVAVGRVVEQAAQEMAERTIPNDQLAALFKRVCQAVDADLPLDMVLERHYHVYTEGFKNLPVAWAAESLNDWKRDLLNLWGAIVGKALILAGRSDAQFDVGFAVYHKSVEERALAMYERRDGRMMFYINPQSYGDEPMLPVINKKRRPELILWLMQLAAHEVTHATGYEYHNEQFMVAEADLMRKMTVNYREFLALGGKKLLVV